MYICVLHSLAHCLSAQKTKRENLFLGVVLEYFVLSIEHCDILTAFVVAAAKVLPKTAIIIIFRVPLCVTYICVLRRPFAAASDAIARGDMWYRVSKPILAKKNIDFEFSSR